MVHEFIGHLGHFLVIFSFVLSLFASFSYLKASTASELMVQKGWNKNGRAFFYFHTLALFGVIAVLFTIIYNNYFEYHYAWNHSSRHLPFYYKLSCFWEGQEGSFLLWAFWNCILGLLLIRNSKSWEGPVMTIFALVQAFLTSMILGVVFLDIKIGSSPFLLLRDVMTDAPVFDMNPDFIPEDGTGLNPLLQNYWMVIHPPVLFLGYATTLVPFAFLMAGLWLKRFKDWVKPALPWTIFSVAVLGLGQLMGAYWAYETLSFGGYWNWDPVENAVYVPWIIQVAGLHTMIIYKKNNTALKSSMILTIATFILVLYATFLTRSGVLGNASVHAFTDLGLNGQLLIYMFVFLIIAVVLTAVRWNQVPSSEKEMKTYTSEFWIFIGALVFTLMGFHVFVGTSIPVYNKLFELVGMELNMAPPTDQVGYYTSYQQWGAVMLTILSGIGITFWWRRTSMKKVFDELILPALITLALSAFFIFAADVRNLLYIVLLTTSIFGVTANASILFKILKKKPDLSGGAVAHIGVALMIIGILFSSGYSNVISLNKSGMVYSKDLPDEMNRENVLLFLDEPREMNEYELIYKGQRKDVKGFSQYVNVNQLLPTNEPHLNVLKSDLTKGDKVYFEAGDTVEVSAENTYYEIEYRKNDETAFTLYPRAQVNPSMGLVVSPDIKRGLKRDLYTHISTIPDPEKEVEWSDPETHLVTRGEQFFVNDYVATLNNIQRIQDVPGVILSEGDVAVKAYIEIMGKSSNYMAEPIFLIKNNMVGNVPYTINELGVKVNFTNVKPETNSFEFSVQTTQKDYVIMKAIEKPYINVLWLGTLVLMVGFGIAVVRRYKEFRQSENAQNANGKAKFTSGEEAEALKQVEEEERV